MARITVEDCLAREGNRFALVLLAAGRAKQLAQGASPRVASHNREAVVALREIAAGHVKFNENVKDVLLSFIAEKKLLAAATQPGRVGAAHAARERRESFS